MDQVDPVQQARQVIANMESMIGGLKVPRDQLNQQIRRLEDSRRRLQQQLRDLEHAKRSDPPDVLKIVRETTAYMVEVAAELEQLYQPPAGTRRRGTSRAPASVGENPIPPSGGPAGDTPPVIHLREIAPVPRKVLSLLAKGSTPPATLDEAILAAYPEGLSTPEKLLKGGLSGAITGLIRLRNNPSEVESAPTRLRQLYNELGLPGRWEEVETALRQWGVLKDSAA